MDGWMDGRDGWMDEWMTRTHCCFRSRNNTCNFQVELTHLIKSNIRGERIANALHIFFPHFHSFVPSSLAVQSLRYTQILQEGR